MAVKPKKVAPTNEGGGDLLFEDYNHILVPLTPLRMELSRIQKEYETDTLPLGELLKTIAGVIKNDRTGK